MPTSSSTARSSTPTGCSSKPLGQGQAIDLWYAGKTHDFGGNIQAIMSDRGIPLWSPTSSRETSWTSPRPQLVLDIVRRSPPRCPSSRPRLPGCRAGNFTPVKQSKDGGNSMSTPHLQRSPSIPALPRGARVRTPRSTLAHLQHVSLSPSGSAVSRRPHSSSYISSTA